jgi:hypothetical protein
VARGGRDVCSAPSGKRQVTQEGGACKFLIVALLDRGIYSMLWLMVGKFDVFWPRQNEYSVARVALCFRRRLFWF